MSWKTTVALLLITVCLGVYVSQYELRQPAQEESETLSKRVVDIAEDQVTEISVKWPSVTATMRRTDDGWKLVTPIAVPADPTHVDRLLRQLAPLDAERVLRFPANKPPALSELGLDPPIGTIALTLKSGKPVTLLFGQATALGANQYAKRADSPTIYVVHDGNRQLLDQSIDAYRSRDVWRFEPFRATKLTVESAQARYTMDKRQERWFLADPIDDAVDNAEASMLLSRLRNLRSERLIADAMKPEDAPTYGLDAPLVRAQVTLEGGQTKTLLVGKPVKDAESLRYAKAEDEPSLHGVAVDSVQQWLKPVADFRSRTGLEFFAGQVTKAQLMSGGKTWTAEKQGEAWRWVEGNAPLDRKKTEDFLWKIHDTKFTRFVEDKPADLAKYGLTAPSAMARIWTAGSAEPQELKVGATSDQGGRYATASGRTALAELPAAITELLSTAPESLKAQEPAPAPTAGPAAAPAAQPSTAAAGSH